MFRLPRPESGRLVLLMGGLLLGPLLLLATPRHAWADDAPGAAPNIVLINLDDADAELLSPRMLNSYFPNIRRLAESGMSFTNVHATTPFCSASRAALMTGKYAFHNQVKVNNPTQSFSNGFSGGYDTFLAEGHGANELGMWMKGAGYRTMHLGKYHHHNFDFQVPPGWDEFHVTLGMRYFGTYRFTNRDVPAGAMMRTGLDEYITDFDAAEADRLIRSQMGAPASQPFLLYMAPIAPHYPEGPTPAAMVNADKYGAFAEGETIPPDPDWNEADVSDKPAQLQLPLMTEWELDWYQEEYISRIRAMKSVDDLVGRVFATLEETEQLADTYIFLTSDNGYQLGHHRTAYKLDPYDRSTRVPLFVSGPGIPAGVVAHFLLAHLDLCPTLLELGGAPLPPDLDGKSFAPLLHDPASFDEAGWQNAIMIENWQTKNFFGRTQPTIYTALRFFDSVYVSWANGAREYYDLANDPFQLDNLYPSLPEAFQQQLAEDLMDFRTRPTIPQATIREEATVDATAGFLRVDGFAEDDTRVDRVGLIVRSYFTGQYFNGREWQFEYASVDVGLASSSAPITSWDHFAFLEPPAGLTMDYLVIMARAYDGEGNYQYDLPWTVRPLDMAAPEAFFTNAQPTYLQSNDPLVLTGGIRDDFLIDRVRIVLRNQLTGQYYNGSGWQDRRATVLAELTGPTSWRVAAPLDTGSYVVSARAMDTAGNWQEAPDVIRFEVRSSEMPLP